MTNNDCGKRVNTPDLRALMRGVRCPTRGARLLLQHLALYAKHDGSGIFPSVARLAYELDETPRSVRRSLSALVAANLLTEEYRRGGSGRTSRYAINVDGMLAAQRPEWKRKRTQKEDNSVPQKEDNGVRLLKKEDNSVLENEDNSVLQKEDNGVRLLKKEDNSVLEKEDNSVLRSSSMEVPESVLLSACVRTRTREGDFSESESGSNPTPPSPEDRGGFREGEITPAPCTPHTPPVGAPQEEVTPSENPNFTSSHSSEDYTGWHKTCVEANAMPNSPSIPMDILSHALQDAARGALAHVASRPGLLALRDPLRWLQEGADLYQDVLPSVRAVAARSQGRNIQSWAYFTAAVQEARERRLSPRPEPRVRRRTEWTDKNSGPEPRATAPVSGWPDFEADLLAIFGPETELTRDADRREAEAQEILARMYQRKAQEIAAFWGEEMADVA